MQFFRPIALIGALGLTLGSSVAVAANDNTAKGASGASPTRTTSSRVADWEVEKKYWQENYSSRPYSRDMDYTSYEPAYRYGIETYNRNPGKKYDELSDADLRAGWERFKDKSSLTWERAKEAVRDAYDRVANMTRD